MNISGSVAMSRVHSSAVQTLRLRRLPLAAARNADTPE